MTEMEKFIRILMTDKSEIEIQEALKTVVKFAAYFSEIQEVLDKENK